MLFKAVIDMVWLHVGSIEADRRDMTILCLLQVLLPHIRSIPAAQVLPGLNQ